MTREIVIEHRGGVTTPLRLFAVIYEWRGLVRHVVALTEVGIEIRDDVNTIVMKDEEEKR